MSTSKKWDNASEKDLIFAMLMSTGDGSAKIQADWAKVEEIMASWGYTFTMGAMSQHWSKKIQKAFKERHPDNAKDGGNANPATPSKAGGTGSSMPKTPPFNKGKGKGKARKRAAPDEDSSPESGGAFNPTPIAQEKALRASAKKMKCSEETDMVDEEEHVMIKGETKTDEDYHHAV